MAVCGGLVADRDGILVGIGLGLGFAGGSWWFSDQVAIRAARARRVRTEEARDLRAMVAALARRAGLPAPRLYWSSSPQPNVFATGRNPKHAAVIVTEGLLTLLERDEIRAVLAHELAHVRQRDTLLTSVTAVVATAVWSLACLAPLPKRLGGRSRADRPGPVGALLMAIVAPLAGGIFHLALLRSREFDADRAAADITGDSEALARALLRIDRYVTVVPMASVPAHAQAWVVSPLRPGFDFERLFSTHPSVADRVARLRARPVPHQ